MPTLAELSREEIYQRVWSISMVQLAQEFGISDVALKKHCKKRNIPTPARGYWARIEARQRIKKPRLPKAAVPENLRPDSAGRSPWPTHRRGWCQRARIFEETLHKKKIGYRGLIDLEDPRFVETSIMPDRIADAARIFHTLLVVAEPAGCLFKPYHGTYQSGYFLIGQDKIRIVIQDADYHRIAQYKVNRQVEPKGKLMLVLGDHGYLRDEKKSWLETEFPDLKALTEAAATALTTYGIKLARQRAIEREEQKISHAKWLVECEEKEKRDHESAMDRVDRQRVHDLLIAAEWERLYENAAHLVRKTEAGWLELGPLSPAQRAWLDWARRSTAPLSIRSAAFPIVDEDGPFDRASVPFGGPYPPVRKFPRPPTMPEMTSETQNGNTTYTMGSSPYPFWRRNR